MSETTNIAEFLATVSFFSEVSKTSLQNLSDKLSKEVFVKGQQIFKKNDKGDRLYIILEGSVKVHDNDHIYDILNERDCFGEYALIDNNLRSASVTTMERTVVFTFGRKEFLALMISDSGFSQGILAVMIKRHRELDTAQEHLASSKKLLEVASSQMKGLIEGAMDAIIMFDASFRIVLTNPSANQLFENNDVLKRNVLFFFDEPSANLIESLVKDSNLNVRRYLPKTVKVVGSNETHTLNEGTISNYGKNGEVFYTLILRNVEDRILAENTINLLTKQTEYLEEEIKELTNDYGITTEHLAMKNVLNLVDQVAGTDATVLITGETGTGKELVARAIHKASTRNEKPLIRINCGAIPTNLIESELFGHKKGAFTGATVDRKGRFLLADKGTIFLDEIGELPLELQPKLLRVIQEGEFDPVGSSETVKVDVRIIAATHRDLLKHAQQDKFREDLYYRLNVFPIQVPPLRVRGNDIILLAEQMIEQGSKKLTKQQIALSTADKKLFLEYSWPGNVRELQNLIERAIIVSKKGNIDWLSIIPMHSGPNKIASDFSTQKILNAQELSEFERDNIVKALKATRWKISGKDGAAELLQLPPTTLASKIKSFGIERPI